MVTLGVSISITDWESDSLFHYKKMQLWVVMATTDDDDYGLLHVAL